MILIVTFVAYWPAMNGKPIGMPSLRNSTMAAKLGAEMRWCNPNSV